MFEDGSLHEQMKRDGFVAFHQVFDANVIDSIADSIELQLESEQAGSGRKSVVKFSQKIAEQLPLILEFAKRPELVSVATCLLGPNLDLYFNQAVYKYPGDQKPFSWHQDDAYGPVEPSPYLTIWIALSDATIENGCLWALPGSHLDGLRNHDRSDFGLSGYSMDAEDQGVPLPLSKGSFVAMWSTTMHKSGANTTASVRKGLVLQYAPVGLKHKASGMAITSKTPISRSISS